MIDNLDLETEPENLSSPKVYKNWSKSKTITGNAELDKIFGVDHPPVNPSELPISKRDEDKLIADLDGLVNLKPNEQYPRQQVASESEFFEKRRQSFTSILEIVGKPDYANELKALMVTYEDISQSEQQQGILLQKVLTYAEKAMDLIRFIDVGEMLCGNPDSKNEKDRGLIGLALDDLNFAHLNEAQLAIASFKKDKGTDGTGKATGLGLAPSSVTITESDVEAWMNNNVPDYKELRYEYNLIATATRTLKRFLYQVNRVAQSNERLTLLYPTRFDISDLKRYFDTRIQELQQLINQSNSI